MGFFPGSAILATPPKDLVPKCGACGLYKQCLSPKMVPSGNGRRKILIVGEAPGELEDKKGIQFVGKAGRFLRDVLASVGIENMRRDCWFTNALICRPPDNTIKDRRMVDYCRPNLRNTIERLRPRVVVLLGATAVRSLVGDVWRENPGPISRWVGWNIPSQALNAWICPTWHPSYLLREHNEVLELHFKKHLKRAVAHKKYPWKKVPDWRKHVHIELNSSAAARVLSEFERKGGSVAFDYETTAQKPEYAGAEVICAAACWRGRRTIAFPWHGKAIGASKKLLRSSRCGKIAANLKFEDRWTRHIFGCPVRNWIWDTMLAAHVIDGREGTKSLKFQAFVNFGVCSYDDMVRPFMRGGTSKINSLRENVDLRDLLLYCGMDALLEHKLAEKQYKILERRL